MPNPEVDDAPTVELTPEQRAVVERIATGFPSSAPAGWLRIVSRQESTWSGSSADIAMVEIVVVETPDGLVQQDYDAPRDLFFVVSDLLEELASQSPTESITFLLVVDRDGSWSVTVTQDSPKLLVGIRDESSSRPVHDYLERNRTELEELAGRLG